MRRAGHGISLATLCLLGFACGSGSAGVGFGADGGVDSSGPSFDGGPDIHLGSQPGSDSSTACTGLECQVHACSGGASTTISGKVYDPAAKDPLYDIVVYVPNSTPDAFKPGVSCDNCSDLYTGHPITTALTDASGSFTLKSVPDGTDIPLVIQVGKWRKQLKISTVKPCVDNPQPDKSLTLPRNHLEGDIPNIAISTGGFDTLECLLYRIGVDASEYEPGPTGPGRLHVFQGSGLLGTAPNTSPPAPSSSASLWDSAPDIDAFDMVLLSCEGLETENMDQGVLYDYAAAGGRVFASHFHYAWFDSGPFGAKNLATWTPGIGLLGTVDTTIETTLPSGKPFPKGEAMKEWLTNVGALTGGQLPVVYACHNSDVSVSNAASLPWIVDSSPSGGTEYFSFDTPFGAPPASQCGRVVYSDLHVGAASSDDPFQPVPMDCANVDLSPQEKALEFMLFDLAACVTPNGQPPAPPSPQPK
jgi:hypothetical protein